MNHCKTCKWWAQFDNDPEQGACELTISSDGRPIIDPPPLAYAADWESYRAELVTNAMYGCVQWEPKDGENTPPDWRERFDRLAAAVMLEDDEVRYRILRNAGGAEE